MALTDRYGNALSTGSAAAQDAYNRGLDLFLAAQFEAPASFEAKDDSGIALHRGRLSATVPPEASGFRVETPSANIVDFGTEFSIDVDDDHSEIHVFDGHVQVQPFATASGNKPAGASNVIDLKTSQAVRINRRTILPYSITRP